MSWLFSQVLVEEFLGENFSDGEPSAPLNGNPTQLAYCSPDKTMAFSRLSRFGMTFKPLTAGRGEELLMSYLAASRARTSVQQERKPELKANDQDSGEKWRGSFTRYDPDTSSWRTHQCSLLEGWELFSETWPQWGSMQGGVCWEQTTLALPTVESESGFWPTPTVCGNYNRKGLSKTSGDGLATAVKKWPTPVASMSKGSSQATLIRKSGKSREADRLDHAVMASDGGQLNPSWVEWLMGWPIGWTDLKPLETGRFRQWQQQHGECLLATEEAREAA